MTGPALYRKRWAALLCGNLANVLIVLLPTWVLLLHGPDSSLTDSGGLDAGWLLFAGGITGAALLESASVRVRFNIETAATRDRAAMRVAQLVGLTLLCLFWAAQVERALAHGTAVTMALRGVGTAMMVAGIALRFVAIRALGPLFVSDVQVGQEVVRTGIYARLRHPSELGLLLLAIGAPLTLGAAYTALSSALLLAPASVWRVYREDVALSAVNDSVLRRGR